MLSNSITWHSKRWVVEEVNPIDIKFTVIFLSKQNVSMTKRKHIILLTKTANYFKNISVTHYIYNNHCRQSTCNHKTDTDTLREISEHWSFLPRSASYSEPLYPSRFEWLKLSANCQSTSIARLTLSQTTISVQHSSCNLPNHSPQNKHYTSYKIPLAVVKKSYHFYNHEVIKKKLSK